MMISGTFLKSKISQRIALMLLLAAAIPALSITVLSHRTINQLVAEYEHASLVSTSQSYALSVFANLKLAYSILLNFAENSQNDHWQILSSEKLTVFDTLILLSAQGDILKQQGKAKLTQAVIKNILVTASKHKTSIIMLKSEQNHKSAVIAFVLPYIKNNVLHSIYVAEINPNFLWGDKSDYPSSVSACAYRISGNEKSRLFCSSEVPKANSAENARTLNHGAWELFMRAEFNEAPWIFETYRLYNTKTSNTWHFIRNNDFLRIAMFSLLLVALLTLIQIRKTMVPLEHLIDETRNIAKGNFRPVNVDNKSEFAELNQAFSLMSSKIQRQLDTLSTLSKIDRDIITKLDIENLIEQVIYRIWQLKPEVNVGIFHLNEKSECTVQCTISLAHNAKIQSARKTITIDEINTIESYVAGKFSDCEAHSQFTHHRVMHETGAKHLWTLPILWQGDLCAFLCITSKQTFDQVNDSWGEITELASRIGIVISAQQREKQLLAQAQYDALTSLPNRVLLHDRLNQAIEHGERSGNPIWVMFIDLDLFKFVNDSLGHQVGDALLVQIAQRLQAEVRETDTVARFGGDEFIILLQGGMDEHNKMGILNRLVDCVATPVKIQNRELMVTCSLGIAVYPNDGTTADTLIKHADIAMYRAKELGRNNFQFFTQSMNEKVAKRVRMENLLRNAISQNELSLHYQPKLDLNSMQIVGMEALIRWNNPELGLVTPLQFIPLAEETGLIIPIGEWVIRTACEQTAKWAAAGLAELTVSVNVSARQFKQNNLINTIKHILHETGLKAHQLELELTESMIMNEIDVSPALLHEIKSLGVQISVDDFGTGYSSLAYLKNLPLDTLKIDKTFIDDINMRTDKAPIVDTIIALAKNLDLKIIAEGVETSEQAAYLKDHGCYHIQGYYFSKAKNAADFEAILIETNNHVNTITSSLNMLS